MIEPQSINLREADGYVATEADLIVDKLKFDGLYKPNLLYRGFDGKKLKILLEHGTDTPNSDTIFCGDEGDLRREDSDDGMDIIYHALLHKISALVVYDGSKLTDDSLAYQQKTFTDPKNKLEALVAIYVLQK